MQVQFYVMVIVLLVHIVGAYKNLGFNHSDGVVGRLEKILCESNPKYGRVTCNTKPKSRFVVVMNVNFKLSQTLSAFKYHCKAYYQFSNNEYRPMLFDVRIDYCEVEAGSAPSVFHEALRKLFRNHTNAFQRCPIAPGDYYVKDWNFVVTDLPSVIPAGRYLIRTKFSTVSDELVVSTAIYFRIDNHGILDLNVG